MKRIEVVAAIIINNSKILCMQRGKSEQRYISYKYELPGGKIESGETKTGALKREIYEEMNISVEVADEDLFMTVDHTYPDFALTMHSYICHVDSQDFVRKEHVNHKWVKPEDLNTLDWAEADFPIVKKLMELNLC